MKNWLLGALVVALATSTPMLSEAKRLGSGKSQGMQRSAPAQPAPQTPPPKQAAPQQTAPTPAAAPAAAGATAAAAAPAKRSWMGPIAGLAAGLGLAALMSHLGMGEAFANFLMLALLGVAAVFLIAFLMRRFGRGARQEPALATAGASASGSPAGWSPVKEPAAPQPAAMEPAAAAPMQRSAFTPASADVSVTGQPLQPLGGTGEFAPSSATVEQTEPSQALAATSTGPKLPEGFDLPAFERVAKMIFIRLQAANDARDLDDLRQFTTPEMFAAIRLEIQERGAAAQQTDVERVEALVIDYAVEDSKQIVSVRFQGLVREEAGAAAQGFDEVWHLVKPEGDTGTWAIAGIQQPQ